MFCLMKWSKQSCVWLAGTALLIGGQAAVQGDAKTNPYDLIVERNPFGLKPPPPPPDPNEAPKAPPPPLATVELTGITSILSSKRALFEIVPGPGKPMIKPILSEGERVESIEVVSINVEKNEVVVKNGGTVTNLTFKVAKSTPSSPTGAVPPPVIPGLPPPAQTSLNNQNQQNQGGGGRYNVMVAGGGGTAAPALGGAPAYGGANPALGAGASALNTGSGADGFRSIPSRKILSNNQVAPQMSAEEAVINVELNRELNKASGRVLPPLPPTPLTPSTETGDGGNQNPQQPGGSLPGGRRFPVRLPPMPGR